MARPIRSGVNRYNQEEGDLVVVDAFRFHAYTQTEIGNFLNLHRATINKTTNKVGRQRYYSRGDPNDSAFKSQYTA